jgi:hypothetical protein
MPKDGIGLRVETDLVATTNIGGEVDDLLP